MSGIPLPRTITWYRSPLPPGEFKKLHERSDLLGGLQTIGYLGVLVGTGGSVLYSAGHFPWWATALLLLLHGMMYAYLINAVHELGHGTVFRTKMLNEIFVRVCAFLCMSNYIGFQTSHARHHRYTLHQPDDQEVILPVAKVLVRHFILTGIVNPMGLWPWLKGNARVACGRIEGEWETRLFPAGSAERRAFVNWQRTMIAGHTVLILGSIYFHLWLLPVLVTLGPFYGGWLQSMANGTQHVGLQDDVSDFRLCCRTFTVNPRDPVSLLAHELPHRASHVRGGAVLPAGAAAPADQARPGALPAWADRDVAGDRGDPEDPGDRSNVRACGADSAAGGRGCGGGDLGGTEEEAELRGQGIPKQSLGSVQLVAVDLRATESERDSAGF